eukprot:361912-Pleurochrysis_carterae.AAC.3
MTGYPCCSYNTRTALGLSLRHIYQMNYLNIVACAGASLTWSIEIYYSGKLVSGGRRVDLKRL